MLNLRSLNPQQRLAVETIRGPVLILAGAGTGKTRVITYRIAHLIEKSTAPGNILGVTFTNKAARDMLERVNQLVPRRRNAELKARTSELQTRNPESETRNGERPTICTFHSLCVRILRRHIEKLGYKRNFVIYNESEQLGVIKKILSQISAKGEKTDPAAILRLLSRGRNGGLRAVEFADESAAAMAHHIRSRYETALRACNAVDFDDLILLTLRLFQEHPQVLEVCRATYRYVMVDEYQDTNATQFELVHALTKEHRNLCVVGDDDQSIYGWRGAEIANLLDMEKHFPEVSVIKLEQNYRSTTTILTAANAVIKNNPRRRGKQLWSQKGQGTKIVLHTFESEEEEARTVVEEIEFQRQARRVPWSDHAILFRMNIQSRPLETALRQAEVRYHLVGGQSFFDRREVKDFLAYLKVFLNPDDDVGLLRIANVPARGLSDVTMERLLAASQERKCSVFAAMKNPAVQATFLSRTRESIEAFVGLVERKRVDLSESGVCFPPTPAPKERENRWQRVGELDAFENFGRRPLRSPLPGGEGQGEGERKPFTRQTGHSTTRFLQAWAEHFMDEIGYMDELRRSEKEAGAVESRVRNLKDLFASMDEGDRDSLPPMERLQRFLGELTLDSEHEEENENSGDAVTLITMHSCKGLEFPHVYVVGLEDGLLPHSRSKVESTFDEERRLFYVAITRAMQSLTLSYCAGRKKYGQIMPCHPSPFVKELPAELVEHAEERSHAPISVEAGKNLFAGLRATLEG